MLANKQILIGALLIFCFIQPPICCAKGKADGRIVFPKQNLYVKLSLAEAAQSINLQNKHPQRIIYHYVTESKQDKPDYIVPFSSNIVGNAGSQDAVNQLSHLSASKKLRSSAFLNIDKPIVQFIHTNGNNNSKNIRLKQKKPKKIQQKTQIPEREREKKAWEIRSSIYGE